LSPTKSVFTNECSSSKYQNWIIINEKKFNGIDYFQVINEKTDFCLDSDFKKKVFALDFNDDNDFKSGQLMSINRLKTLNQIYA